MKLLRTIFNSRAWWIFALAVLFVVNSAGYQWHSRIDLTAERRFTISQSTKKVLHNLKAPSRVDVFLKGSFPSGFRKLASSTDDMLRIFREAANGRMQINFISPEDEIPGAGGRLYADTLDAMGLVPINLTSQLKEGQQQQFVYPYALITYNEKTLPVVLYDGSSRIISQQELNSAEAMLEYQFAETFAKLQSTQKSVIGYAVGNGEPMDVSVYDLVENVLKNDYNLATINLEQQRAIPAEMAAMIVVKPTKTFSDDEKLKIDQYVMKGGKVLWFVDRLEAEMDSLQIKNEVVAYDRGLGLNDLFFRYGARVNADLVMDLQCDYLPFDVNGNGQFEFLPWNYFPVLESPENHPINKGLGYVSSKFINSIDTVEAEGIKKTILLTSSSNARTIATPALISGRENVNAPEDEKFRKQHIPVAVLLEGRFRSLYANRLSQSKRDSLLKYNLPFQSEGIENNKMIIVADGDMVLNGIKDRSPIPMGMNSYTYGSQREFPFANKSFLKNSLSYLIDPFDLSEAKGKDYIIRLLDTKKVNTEKAKWQIVNLVLPGLIVLLFAFIFQWMRKQRFAK